MNRDRDNVNHLRLFVGLRLPEDVIVETCRIQAALQKKKLFAGKWTDPKNLHLTLKFLGNVDGDRVPQIVSLLASIKVPAFAATLGKVGVFSSKKVIRIVWVEISGIGVVNLQEHVDAALSKSFDSEHRFMSHLTIARVKSVVDRNRFIETLDNFRIEPIQFVVNNFLLIKSFLTPTGPIYTPITTFPLA